jgi:hypothetical protein
MAKKTKGLCSVAVFLAFLFFSHDTAVGYDAFSAKLVMKGCRNFVSNTSTDMVEQATCGGVVEAIIDIDSQLCVPEGSTLEQSVRVVVTYIDKRCSPARKL